MIDKEMTFWLGSSIKSTCGSERPTGSDQFVWNVRKHFELEFMVHYGLLP